MSAADLVRKHAALLRPDRQTEAELRALEMLYRDATCGTCGQAKCPDCGLPLPDQETARDAIWKRHLERHAADDPPTTA